MEWHERGSVSNIIQLPVAPPHRLEFIDEKDHHDNPPAPVPWLIDRVIQERSLVMLHGPEKLGKSMLLSNIAFAGAYRLPSLFGWSIREGGFRTMIIQGELHSRGLWERHDAMFAAIAAVHGFQRESDRICINTLRNIALMSNTNWQLFLEALHRWKPDAVFIDPFAHVVSGDEKDNEVVGNILQYKFEPLRDRFGTTVLFSHHDSKMSEATFTRQAHQRSRGANRLTADPDTIISLVPHKRVAGIATATLQQIQRNCDARGPLRIRLNKTTLWFAPWSKRLEQVERVAIALAANEPPVLERIEFLELVVKAAGLKAEEVRDGEHRTAVKVANAAIEMGYIREDVLDETRRMYSVLKLPLGMPEETESEDE